MEAPGAEVSGGTPLSDAVAFGQWQAARRLVERGALTPFREAAGLGLTERVERSFASDDPPTADGITQAFWYACHGGQRSVAEYLLDRGADINWISTWDNLTPLDAARRRGADDVVSSLQGSGGRSAGDATSSSPGNSAPPS